MVFKTKAEVLAAREGYVTAAVKIGILRKSDYELHAKMAFPMPMEKVPNVVTVDGISFKCEDRKIFRKVGNVEWENVNYWEIAVFTPDELSAIACVKQTPFIEKEIE